MITSTRYIISMITSAMYIISMITSTRYIISMITSVICISLVWSPVQGILLVWSLQKSLEAGIVDNDAIIHDNTCGQLTLQTSTDFCSLTTCNAYKDLSVLFSKLMSSISLVQASMTPTVQSKRSDVGALRICTGNVYSGSFLHTRVQQAKRNCWTMLQHQSAAPETENRKWRA